jgi:hypothetical protein
MTFNPQEHLIDYQGKPYLPVVSRVVWFREKHGDKYSIETTVAPIGTSSVLGSASIRNESGRILATAHKTKPINEKDSFAKAETGAIGRALGFLGFGTELATQDFEEGDEIVDQALGSNLALKKAIEIVHGKTPLPPTIKPVVTKESIREEQPVFPVSPGIAAILAKQASKNPIELQNEAPKAGGGLKLVSPGQVKRLFAVAKSVNMPPQVWLEQMQTKYGHQEPAQLDWKQYKEFVDDWMMTWKNQAAVELEPDFLAPDYTMQPVNEEELPF